MGLLRATGEDGESHTLKHAIFKTKDEAITKGKWFIARHRMEGWLVEMMNDSVATLPPANGWYSSYEFRSEEWIGSFSVRPIEVDELTWCFQRISSFLFPLQHARLGLPE